MEIRDFIRVTAGGVDIADFVDIRSAIIARYKEIYGSDIDLSTASADGVFVNDLALIINNILQSVKIMYSNLDVRTASGIYLDSLCNLSNVQRKPATRSVASIQVKNLSTNEISIPKSMQFNDQSGMTWSYNGNAVNVGVGQTVEISVTCDTAGVVEAPAGWITSTLQSIDMSVTQPKAAILGSDIESDSELRARRTQSSGANGITVLESLVGALLNVSGIEDVKVYNNDSGTAITSNDGSTIDAHSIYTIVRRDSAVTIADETIGTIIYEKLTPGIHSCDMLSSAEGGTGKSYVYVGKVLGNSIPQSKQTVYWKEATPIAPAITITITPKEYFTTDEFTVIYSTLSQYLNGLSISENLDKTDILIQTTFADPLFKARPTYSVANVTIDENFTVNPDTYYNYTSYEFSKLDNGNYILTLSKKENG